MATARCEYFKQISISQLYTLIYIASNHIPVTTGILYSVMYEIRMK